MSECMTQEDAMKMDNNRAIEILKPFQKMMVDQHGCPISDAYFALGKAIEALEKETCEIKEIVEDCDECGFCGRWLEKNIVRMEDELDDSNVIDAWQSAKCSHCGLYHTTPFRYSFDYYEFCPHCGKPMKGDKK